MSLLAQIYDGRLCSSVDEIIGSLVQCKSEQGAGIGSWHLDAGTSLDSSALTNSDAIGNDNDDPLNVNTNDNVKEHWSITKDKDNSHESEWIFMSHHIRC